MAAARKGQRIVLVAKGSHMSIVVVEASVSGGRGLRRSLCIALAILLSAGLAACVSASPQHMAQPAHHRPPIAFPNLPADADLSAPDRQKHLLTRGLYLTASGEIRALPPDYRKSAWKPVVEKPGTERAAPQSDRRIRIDLRRPR